MDDEDGIIRINLDDYEGDYLFYPIESDFSDNDDEYDWAVLRPGVLTYPVSLRLQCLMFIVGHLFDDISPNSVALLPRSIRYQLLLLLPAVDVCKLEGTPVTHDISMDEIWETLYRERIQSLLSVDLHKFGWDLKDINVELITPQSLSQKGIECDWKESYFNTVFSFHGFRDGQSYQYYNCFQDECFCTNNHFVFDLLYCMSMSSLTEFYQCFNEHATLSIHGIYQCAHSCPRLTTKQHYHKFLDTSGAPHKKIDLIPFMNMLVDCQITLKYLGISESQLKSVRQEYLLDPQFLNNIEKLVVSVEGINIYDDYTGSKDENEKMKKILDLVFFDNVRLIKSVTIENENFIDVLFPYLTKSTECSLKHLEFNLHIFDNNIKHEELLIKLLRHHQQLETVRFFVDSSKKVAFQCTDLLRNIANLMNHPTMKELTFHCTKNGFTNNISVSVEVIECFFKHFFSSPYPISLSLNLQNTSFNSVPEPFPVHQEQMNKSLTLHGHFNVNLFSLFPQTLTLQSLHLNESGLVHLFARLKSITVLDKCKVISWSADTTLDVCTLLTIVTAKEWDLSVNIEDSPHTVDGFINALPNISNCLQRFVQDYGLDVKSFLIVLKAVLSTISSSKPPYFVLGLPIQYIASHSNDIYDIWEKCGAVKLKRIEVSDGRGIYGFDHYNGTLDNMALEVIELI